MLGVHFVVLFISMARKWKIGQLGSLNDFTAVHKRLCVNKKPRVEHEVGSLESRRPKVTNMKRAQYFSWLWKTGKINRIPKPTKPPTLSENYCSISLMPRLLILKIFEQLLLAPSRLLVNDIICEGAVRRVSAGHSTTLKLADSSPTIRRHQYSSVDAVLLDVRRKTFNKDRHEGLF